MSCDAYRAVVRGDPRFIEFFLAATPVSELGRMNIGSRPAKRKAAGRCARAPSAARKLEAAAPQPSVLSGRKAASSQRSLHTVAAVQQPCPPSDSCCNAAAKPSGATLCSCWGCSPACFMGCSIDQLRAIPWIFAWTQTRFHLPVWLGIGDAFQVGALPAVAAAQPHSCILFIHPHLYRKRSLWGIW